MTAGKRSSSNPFLDDDDISNIDVDEMVVLDDLDDEPAGGKSDADGDDGNEDLSDIVDDGGSGEHDSPPAAERSDASEALRRQIDELRESHETERRENLRRQAGIAATTIGNEVSAADNDIAQLKRARAAARARGEWDAVDRADDLIEQAKARKAEASHKLARLSEFVREIGKPVAKPNVRANEWASRNSGWFNPAGNDEKSVHVRNLSASLAAEGYDPKGEAHFKELDRRLKRKWPELYANRGSNSGAFKAHVAGGSTSAPAAGRKGANMLPKAVLKYAQMSGLDIEDKEVRKRLLRNYNESTKGIKK